MSTTKQVFLLVMLAVLAMALLACSITISPFSTPVSVTVVVPVTQIVPATSVPSVLVYQVQVFANKGWQDTGIVVNRGQQVTIEYVSGLWFEDPPGIWHDASGGPNPWICTAPECHEPLHDFPKYALIGRLDGDVLRIGNRLDFVAEVSGVLQLRPNYGDVDILIHNPQGAVTVKITIH